MNKEQEKEYQRHLTSLDKETLISLYLQKCYELVIAEAELDKAIVPKFKPHSDLFVIVGYKDEPKIIEQYYIDEIVVRGDGKYIEYRDIGKETIVGENNLLFATEEEARAKLKELQNG